MLLLMIYYMYTVLFFFHSLFRWLVLLSLLYAIFRACRGYLGRLVFTKTDNLIRHLTATIAHVQLMIGIILYSQSPNVKLFFSAPNRTAGMSAPLFFGVIHMLLMLMAIVLITIGSALAKRRAADKEKFRTMLIWFTFALVLIFVAIPWPFSPFAQRPYYRTL